MRINKFIAQATGLSRRGADAAIVDLRVHVNGSIPTPGMDVTSTDMVTLDGATLQLPSETTTILLNKPVGYVVSRNGQGAKTIYDLLPATFHHLKPIGRIDKDSSGLLLLTDDGLLANALTHPRHHKRKVYQIALNKPLQPMHRQMINDIGINLDDGRSKLELSRITEGNDTQWQIAMYEGRNRQIRRTFESLGYTVTALHRISFGAYSLADIALGSYKVVTP